MRLRHRLAAWLAFSGIFVVSLGAVVTSDAFVRRLVRGVLARTFRGPAHFTEAQFTLREGLVVRGLEILDPADPLGPPAVVVDTFRADWGLAEDAKGLRVTEVVLERPTGRVRRLADGSLSIASLLEPIPEDTKPAALPPEVRIVDATLSFEDPSILSGGPVTLEHATARLAPEGDAWRIDFSASSEDLGEVSVRAFVAPGGGVTAGVDLPHLPVGPDLFSRLRVPGVAQVAAVGGWGTVRAHVEVAYVPGSDVILGAKVDLAGLAATIRVPEIARDVSAPEPIEVRVAAGIAELRGDSIELSGLEVLALGASATCPSATLEGLHTPAPQVTADLRIDGLALTGAVCSHLPFAAREVIEAYGIGGAVSASIRADGALAAPHLTVEANLAEGRISFEGYPGPDGRREGFPWKVTDVSGAVSYDGARLLFSGTGRHGPAKVRAEGGLDWSAGDEIPEVTIVVEDAPLDADVRAAFQDRAEKSFDRWGPSGTAARIVVRVVRDPHADGPRGSATEVELHLDGRASMKPALLPMTLGRMRGVVRLLAPQRGDHRAERIEISGLRATGEGLEVTVDGRVDTDREVAEDDLVVTARVADLGGAVREAVMASTEFIPETVKKLLVDLGARGPADITAAVAGGPERRSDRVTIELRGASVTGYGRDIPFAADAVTGRVVVDRDEVLLEDISALALGTTLHGSGRLLGISGTIEPDVRIEAAEVPLGPPLRRALGKLARPADSFWDKLRPVGEPGTLGTRADVAVVLRPSGAATPVELWLSKIRGPLLPLGLELDTRGGELHYDGRMATMRLSAAVGAAEIDLRQARLDIATGRLEADADVRGLRFPEDLEGIFSEETVARLREMIPDRNLTWTGLSLAYVPGEETLDLAGALRISPRNADAATGARGRKARAAASDDDGLAPEGALDVSRMSFQFLPELPLAFDLSADAREFRIRTGVQLEDFHGPLSLTGQISDEGVELTARTVGARMSLEGFPVTDATIDAALLGAGPRAELAGTFHGGRLTARIHPGRAVKLTGQVHLRDVDLASVAGAASGVKGRVGADCNFTSAGGSLQDLRGTAELWVKEGDLGKFPLFSAVYNAVSSALSQVLSVIIPADAGNLTDASLTANVSGPSLNFRDLVIRGPWLTVKGQTGWVAFDGRLDIEISADCGLPVIPALPYRVTGTIRNPVVRSRILSSGAPTPPEKEAPAPGSGGRSAK